MLTQKVYIFSPGTVHDVNQYDFSLYFQNTSKEKYFNLNDYVEDTIGNKYKILVATIPFDSGSDAVVTGEAVTNNVPPVEDSDYDSESYTPEQIDYSPYLRSAGALGTATIYSGPNYEYQVLTGWNSSLDANKAVVGDRIVDANGKEFEISYIHISNRFNDPIRIKEVERIGDLPIAGNATLFRGTLNFGMFQGTEITDPARTTIFNRDKVIVDQNLNSGGGITPESYTNTTGGLMSGGRVVRTPTSGNMAYANWDTEVEARGFGILLSDTANSADGNVQSVGRINSGVILSTDFDEGVLPTGNDLRIYVGSTDGKLRYTPPVTGNGKFETIIGLWDNGGLNLQFQMVGVA